MDPTIGMLEQMLAVVGEKVTTIAADAADGCEQAPTLEELRTRRNELEQLAEKYGVCNLRVFGSIASGAATAESDVDLLVAACPGTGLLAVESFRAAAEELLERPVDVVTDGAVKGRLADIKRQAVAL